MHFIFIFLQKLLPAAARSTFLKTNSEQSAFKNHFFGALNALNEGSVGHIFGISRFFARSVRHFSASVAHQNFVFRLETCVFPVYEPDQQNDNKYHTCEFMKIPNPVANLHQKCNLQDACLMFFCSDAFRFHIFAKMCSPLKPEAHF